MYSADELVGKTGYEEVQYLAGVVDVCRVVIALQGHQQAGQVLLTGGSGTKAGHDPLKTSYFPPKPTLTTVVPIAKI